MDEEQDQTQEETSGEEDLKSAFGATAPWESDESSAAEGDTTDEDTEDGDGEGDSDTTPDEGSTENADLGPDEETLRKVLSDARVQNQLRSLLEQRTAEQLAAARAAWEVEQELQRAREEEALLDDEEYGKLVRERSTQRTGPSVLAAEQAGFERAQQEFFNMAVTSVWSDVEELKSLPDAKRAELDPANPAYNTYGKYISAVIDTAAAARAVKIAEKMANEMVEAKMADRLSQMRKAKPSPATVSGPSKPPGPLVNLETMSGDQLLKAAFGN